jgi:hypothetical protein
MGLPVELTPAGFVGEPPYAATFPWQDRSPASWRKYRAQGISKENRIAGRSIGIEDGWHACGPVSAAKAEVETLRLSALLASLQQQGFKRHEGRDGDIDAVMLKAGGETLWWINSGHHRAAVLTALDYETAPVRVRQTFDLETVAEWPNVRNGLFTPQAATVLVNRLFDNRLPAALQPWADFCKDSARDGALLGDLDIAS